jgi:hypothetical protein
MERGLDTSHLAITTPCHYTVLMQHFLCVLVAAQKCSNRAGDHFPSLQQPVCQDHAGDVGAMSLSTFESVL